MRQGSHLKDRYRKKTYNKQVENDRKKSGSFDSGIVGVKG